MTRKPALAGADRLAVLGDDLGHDAGQRPRGRAGHGRRGAGQGRDHDRAGLGLPPGIDDRAAPAADDLVVPHPRLGVDRLADGPQEPEARQVVPLRGTARPTS